MRLLAFVFLLLNVGAIPAGALFGQSVEEGGGGPLLLFSWEEGELPWDLAGGVLDPIAASDRVDSGGRGAVLPVPGLGWFEKFQVVLPEGDSRWSDYEFVAMDYRVGPDVFSCNWLDMGLVLSTPGSWWFQTNAEGLNLDGGWHTVLWRYDPRVVQGSPMTVRIATSTGDAGTLLVDRFRLIPSRFSYDFDVQEMDGWTLAEGSGLETRPDRVFSGEGSCRLFLPASTWHRAAWRTFEPGPDLDALLGCNRISLVARRWFLSPGAEQAIDPQMYRLRFRLVLYDGVDGWVETEAREIRSGLGWSTFLMPVEWGAMTGANPVTVFLVTESFGEEELYLDALRFLRVE